MHRPIYTAFNRQHQISSALGKIVRLRFPLHFSWTVSIQESLPDKLIEFNFMNNLIFLQRDSRGIFTPGNRVLLILETYTKGT